MYRRHLEYSCCRLCQSFRSHPYCCRTGSATVPLAPWVSSSTTSPGTTGSDVVSAPSWVESTWVAEDDRRSRASRRCCCNVHEALESLSLSLSCSRQTRTFREGQIRPATYTMFSVLSTGQQTPGMRPWTLKHNNCRSFVRSSNRCGQLLRS